MFVVYIEWIQQSPTGGRATPPRTDPSTLKGPLVGALQERGCERACFVFPGGTGFASAHHRSLGQRPCISDGFVLSCKERGKMAATPYLVRAALRKKKIGRVKQLRNQFFGSGILVGF